MTIPLVEPQITKEAVSPKLYTLEQYLKREERSILKHEFYNGEIKRMAGGTTNHGEIAANIIGALKASLKTSDKKFRVGTGDIAIYISELDFVFYPDGLVVFEKFELKPGTARLVLNPLLIVEVVSRSTRAFDRTDKFKAYKTLTSLKEYVLIERNKAEVETRFIQSTTNWEVTSITDMSHKIILRSLGVEIAMADIYENIEF